jgi:hypothetical protein
MVIVAATARTFFLSDMWYFPFRQPGHTLRAAATRWRRPWDRAGATGLPGFIDERGNGED